jgi:hypothetical protein
MLVTLVGPTQLYTKWAFDRFVMDGIGMTHLGVFEAQFYVKSIKTKKPLGGILFSRIYVG